MRLTAPKVISAAFCGALLVTGFGHFTATQATAAGPSPATIATGKSLITQYACNSCHGKDLLGKPGFSPSLHASGVLKKYNPTTWARVLNTGVTYNGGKVKSPMPVEGMSKTNSLAIWACLETLK
jgi:mono/diheme cytochrome c family protein